MDHKLQWENTTIHPRTTCTPQENSSGEDLRRPLEKIINQSYSRWTQKDRYPSQSKAGLSQGELWWSQNQLWSYLRGLQKWPQFKNVSLRIFVQEECWDGWWRVFAGDGQQNWRRHRRGTSQKIYTKYNRGNQQSRDPAINPKWLMSQNIKKFIQNCTSPSPSSSLGWTVSE